MNWSTAAPNSSVSASTRSRSAFHEGKPSSRAITDCASWSASDAATNSSLEWRQKPGRARKRASAAESLALAERSRSFACCLSCSRFGRSGNCGVVIHPPCLEPAVRKLASTEMTCSHLNTEGRTQSFARTRGRPRAHAERLHRRIIEVNSPSPGIPSKRLRKAPARPRHTRPLGVLLDALEIDVDQLPHLCPQPVELAPHQIQIGPLPRGPPLERLPPVLLDPPTHPSH